MRASVSVRKHVFQMRAYLQIAMYDVAIVAVLDGRQDLPELLPGGALVHFAVASDKICVVPDW